LDRINNDGDYTPENCRWTTHKEQQNNRGITRWVEFNGKVKTLRDWARELGINICTAETRFLKGMSVEKIFSREKLPYTRRV
jgi:hypothetical protein